MKAIARKCGTCRHLRPRSDGKPFWHGHAYKCTWSPPPIVWPASVLSGGYNDPRKSLESPGSYMQIKDGVDCPCWEAKAPESPADERDRRDSEPASA